MDRLKRLSADAVTHSKECLNTAQKKFIEDPVTIRQWPTVEIIDFSRVRDTHDYFVKRFDNVRGKLDYLERKRKQLLSGLHAKNRAKGSLISGRGEKLSDLRRLAEDNTVSNASAKSVASSSSKVTVASTFTPPACPPVPGSNGLLPFIPPPFAGGLPVSSPLPINHIRAPFNSPPPAYFPNMFPYLQTFAAASAAASPASAVASPAPAVDVAKDTEVETNEEESNVVVDDSSPSSMLNTPQHDSEK